MTKRRVIKATARKRAMRKKNDKLIRRLRKQIKQLKRKGMKKRHRSRK